MPVLITMATVSTALSDLPLEQLTLYHASDSCLASVFVFYGPVATANATVSSSRIQAHVFSPAGCQSYPRLTVSPAAPLYAAVNHLPRDKQGDEVCRGLAVSMLKYFADLSDSTKECLYDIARAGKPGGKVLKMFDEKHAADLANRMNTVENNMNHYNNNNALSDTVRDIRGAFQERKLHGSMSMSSFPPVPSSRPRVPTPTTMQHQISRTIPICNMEPIRPWYAHWVSQFFCQQPD